MLDCKRKFHYLAYDRIDVCIAFCIHRRVQPVPSKDQFMALISISFQPKFESGKGAIEGFFKSVWTAQQCQRSIGQRVGLKDIAQ